MKVRNTIAHRGLILVAVPLLFEILFVGVLFYLLWSSDIQTKRVESAKAVSEQCLYLVKSLYETMNRIIGLAIERSDEAESRYKEAVRRIPEQMNALTVLCRNSQKQAVRAEQVELEFNRTMGNLQALHKAVVEEGLGTLEYLRWVQKVRSLFSRLIAALEALAETASQDAQTAQQQQLGVRMYLLPALAAGLSVNIAISVLLAYYFSSSITSRLSRLQENTKRLATNLPLYERLTGTDEIALLDKEFHRMAVALGESVRKERAVIEQAREVICSVDEGGKFIAVNPASLTVWLRQPEDLIGRRLVDVVVEDERARISATISSVIATKSESSIETRILRSDLTELDVLWSMKWSDSENALFCVVVDNSERKELERVKQSFMRMVAHDLRSPLTSMQGTLHVLASGEGLGEENLNKVHRMQRVSERLLQLVNDLLEIEALSQKGSRPRYSSTSSGILVDQALASIESLLQEKRITVKQDIDVFDLELDSDRVVQVMINLLSNAVRFSNANSVIELSVKKRAADAQFSIVDFGLGIEAQHHKEIFEPFKQVQSSQNAQKHGTGLGLAIARAIVESHGGEIGLDSKPGHGSRFWFTIPFARD